MQYKNIIHGKFDSRPNRFIAKVWVNGILETVHVKNTGRCKELLIPGSDVILEISDNPERKTKYDLIGVYKEGLGLVNIDSQAPNKVVKEWLAEQGYSLIKPEYTYGNSRIDFYMEKDEKKYLMEVKGCTLEIDGVGYFPDAPTERGVKHLRELAKAAGEGYECFVAFVIQMEGVDYVRANVQTHKEFGVALEEAKEAGVTVLYLGCKVEEDSLGIDRISKDFEWIVNPLLRWYSEQARELPWRIDHNPYRVWVSEIMLQQTRVEAVIPYFNRFMKTFPEIQNLAEAQEETVLKLWEGLGYYSRARNLKKAAEFICDEYHGTFPKEYKKILSLPGVGKYTAGAISSIAFGMPRAAVDGNVLRVITRIEEIDRDIKDEKFRQRISQQLEKIYPKDSCSQFTQSLMELGAMVCVPNGAPKCEECPLKQGCRAYKNNAWDKYPVKGEKPQRKKIDKTVLILNCDGKIALQKREEKGLLAGLWEFPNVDKKMSKSAIKKWLDERNIEVKHIEKGKEVKHIFTHLEWNMHCYQVECKKAEDRCICEDADKAYEWYSMEEINSGIPLPTAFRKCL